MKVFVKEVSDPVLLLKWVPLSEPFPEALGCTCCLPGDLLHPSYIPPKTSCNLLQPPPATSYIPQM